MDPTQPANQLSAMDGMEEVIKEFLIESNEGLDRFDRDLIALEKDKTSRELLDSIFRVVHTIKGTGGVLAYNKLVSVSHVGESVLSQMRDGALLLSPEIATVLLAMADALRRTLEQIALNGTEGEADCSSVVQQLSDVLKQVQQPPEKAIPAQASSPPGPTPHPDSPPRIGEILVGAEHCGARRRAQCFATSGSRRSAAGGRDYGGPAGGAAQGSCGCPQGANRPP